MSLLLQTHIKKKSIPERNIRQHTLRSIASKLIVFFFSFSLDPHAPTSTILEENDIVLEMKPYLAR